MIIFLLYLTQSSSTCIEFRGLLNSDALENAFTVPLYIAGFDSTLDIKDMSFLNDSFSIMYRSYNFESKVQIKNLFYAIEEKVLINSVNLYSKFYNLVYKDSYNDMHLFFKTGLKRTESFFDSVNLFSGIYAEIGLSMETREGFVSIAFPEIFSYSSLALTFFNDFEFYVGKKVAFYFLFPQYYEIYFGMVNRSIPFFRIVSLKKGNGPYFSFSASFNEFNTMYTFKLNGFYITFGSGFMRKYKVFTQSFGMQYCFRGFNIPAFHIFLRSDS